MKKFSIITLSLMLLTGMMFAQGTPEKVKVAPSPVDNPNLKARLTPDDAPMPMMDMLKLSKEQIAKFQDLRLAHQKKMNTLKAEVENLKLDLLKAIRSENFNDAKKLNDSLYAKKKAMADARLDHIQAMLKELSADQKEIAKEHFMQFWMKGGKGHPGMSNMMRGKGMGHMGQMHMKGRKSGCQGEDMPRMQGRKNKMHDCNDCNDCGEHKQDMPKGKNPNRPETPVEK